MFLVWKLPGAQKGVFLGQARAWGRKALGETHSCPPPHSPGIFSSTGLSYLRICVQRAIGQLVSPALLRGCRRGLALRAPLLATKLEKNVRLAELSRLFRPPGAKAQPFKESYTTVSKTSVLTRGGEV